jgi:hypothetical protein
MRNFLEQYLAHLNIAIRRPTDDEDYRRLRDERERIRKELYEWPD